ncbi:MAG: uroporphyrinogen-III C-methyltransferase [Coriobacteriaceae bacterium]|nr:uroporphyrinogen-III C-methyltransferase [Coriobacteriaceae bacterium]
MGNVKVYLVGAGPGDAKLITVRGLELVKNADVIVYDYLANEEILGAARADAEMHYVGKQGFTGHMTQGEINELLVDLCRKESEKQGNRCIVRLKGGDPFVFGRGGEEAEMLAGHGFEFEIVPGVTSGIAAPAYAGIPVTQRKVASSVTFVTGHEDPTRDRTSIDWKSLAVLASMGNTVCFYMGIRSLPLIAERLMAEGLDGATPVALVRWGTTPKQETLVSALETVAADAERAQFKAPAIILVGRVAAYREKLAWFEGAPLFGKTIVVTRMSGQGGKLSAALAGLGANAICMPTIEIAEPDSYEALDGAIDIIGGYDWIVFTSANGVERFFARMRHLAAGDARSLSSARIAAIGPATAERLESYGIVADVVPDNYRGEGVFEAIRSCESQRKGCAGDEALVGAKVLIPRAQVARDALPALLTESGASVEVAPAYKTVLPEEGSCEKIRSLFASGEVSAVTFTSSSTVRNLVEIIGENDLALLEGVDLFSIGPVTSATLAEKGLAASVEAEEYTIPGLVEAIERFYSERPEAGNR